MLSALFSNISEADKGAAIETIIQHATPRQDFFFMLTLSIAMATFGILLGSTVILVGSMLIAPLLFPLISLALGLTTGDSALIYRSVYTIGKSIVIALATAVILGYLFLNYPDTAYPFGISNVTSSLMYTFVAIIAGFAAAFAMTKPHLNDSLPGVAISVALVPPLAAAGVALSSAELDIFSNALLLFFLNAVGIVASGMVVFALQRFTKQKSVVKETVKSEEKVIAKEEKRPA